MRNKVQLNDWSMAILRIGTFINPRNLPERANELMEIAQNSEIFMKAEGEVHLEYIEGLRQF